MQNSSLTRISRNVWQLEARGTMRVPVVIYADSDLIQNMDAKVLEQAQNVAALPGVVRAVSVMPDGHWGYGFPIGGVAAFDADAGGVVSAGGVGFDISCGVRCLTTSLSAEDVERRGEQLADALFHHIPAGVGSTGSLRLDAREMHAMLEGGARWAVERGYGLAEDLLRIEEGGWARGAKPETVSERARQRQHDQMGTLGSGNHYLEVQRIAELYDERAAAVLGLRVDEVVVSIHCGSRGLGHQIGTDYLRSMLLDATERGLALPDRELACAPLNSGLGEQYLGAMRAGINCALANRQILTHLTRQAFSDLFPQARLGLVYDVSHNTCKEEQHVVDGQPRRLFVHRKGATRAFGPGHPELPSALREIGQPVLIGGSMGTESWVLLGTSEGMQLAFGSACHGAGRKMSRHQAARAWRGGQVIRDLRARGVLVRSRSVRGVAEEAPGAYKDVAAVVEAAHQAGLARKVARLVPLVCVKG